MMEGISPAQCAARWNLLKNFPGLEYASYISRPEKRLLQRSSSSNDQEIVSSIDGNQTKVSPKHNEESNETTQEISIHVCDEARKLNRDFKCDKNLLLRGMGYFNVRLW